jgi:23S rRNA (adenine2503-C2)-methyltransferase
MSNQERATSERVCLVGGDLAALLASWGEPAYRAKQVSRWIYHELVFDPSQMLDLPRRLRDRLAAEATVLPFTLDRERTADRGLTTKGLLRLADGRRIESVLMRYPETANGRSRRTVCISSQVGCAVGCPFCATGLLGLQRQLTAAEIVGQVLYFARRARELDGRDAPLTNVVLMGEGEPLANFRNVKQAVEILNDPELVALGARRITVSTSGLAPRIYDLANELPQVGLAVSLHAPTDDLRNRLVPVNRKYPIAAVLDACRAYVDKTHRRVSFEYAMMRDVNDGLSQAEELKRILSGLLCHVNLIPLNEVEGSPFHPTPRAQIVAFQSILRRGGIPCTVRVTRGDDIAGACGQLRAAAEDTST